MIDQLIQKIKSIGSLIEDESKKLGYFSSAVSFKKRDLIELSATFDVIAEKLAVIKKIHQSEVDSLKSEIAKKDTQINNLRSKANLGSLYKRQFRKDK